VKQAVEVAQRVDAAFKASVLRDIASALAKSGDLKQALEVAQQIEDATKKAFSLQAIAMALVKAGEINQALEVAQKIKRAKIKHPLLNHIALVLATDAIPFANTDNANEPTVPRMKKAFTPQEKQLAKQIVEAMTAN